MKKSRVLKHIKKKHTAAAVALFFAFLAVFLLLTATAGNSPLPGTLAVLDPSGDYLPLLLEDWETSAVFVSSGSETSLLLRLNAATGETESRRELDIPLFWAALRGETLFLREDPSDSAALVACNRETLEEVSRRDLHIRPGSLVFFDCDRQGNVSYVLNGSRNLLRYSSAEGKETVRELPARLEFLGVEDGGSLWAYAGGVLYTASFDGPLQEVPFSEEPYRLLKNGRLISRNGILYQLEKTGPRPLFQCPDEFYDPFSFCLDRENCLIMSKPGGSVSRYGPEGENLGNCALEKTALAVCGTGGIYRREEGLFYSAFSFSAQAFGPSPLPSVSPEPTFSPENPPARVEEGYIIMDAGATADQLRELFKPEAVDIRSLTGKQLLHGRLATGMTAGDWVIVIEGDCNGTGTVTAADLRKALAMTLDAPRANDPQYRAADLNENGVVDTIDLVLLSAMISS